MTPEECFAVVLDLARSGDRDLAEELAMLLLVWAEVGGPCPASARAVEIAWKRGSFHTGPLILAAWPGGHVPDPTAVPTALAALDLRARFRHALNFMSVTALITNVAVHPAWGHEPLDSETRDAILGWWTRAGYGVRLVIE